MTGRAEASVSTSGDAAVRDAARATEPDRYLAALLAPRWARGDLVTLAAFLGEVARIPRVVGDPRIAEIRLQWWADAIGNIGAGRGDASPTGHPLADALTDMALRRGLDRDMLAAAVEARFAEIGGAPLADERALDHALGATEGVGFRLAARVLGISATPATDAALDAAGIAYGLARTLAALPRQLDEGVLRLPVSWPETAAVGVAVAGTAERRAAVSALVMRGAAHARSKLRLVHDYSAHSAHSFNAAILPCALVEPYLQALERADLDAERGASGLLPLVTPLGRVWRLWRAHRRGRL